MKIKILITAIVLTLAMPAVAEFKTVQLAHEVALSDLRLPSHPSGTIGFKGCSECEYQTERVSAFAAAFEANETVTAQMQFEDSSPVPDKAFSLGAGSGIAADHFNATSTAVSERDPGNPTDRDSTAVHTQAFYVVGPADSTL